MPNKLSEKPRRFNFWMPAKSSNQLHYLLVKFTISKPKLRWTMATVLIFALDKVARSHGWTGKGFDK